jgi:fatty acid desaturase
VSNMTENQRAQYERPDLTVPSTGVQVRSLRPLVIYTVIACVALVALGYATIQALDGWAQFVVLGGIVMTVIGGMIAVDPLRKA